MDFAFNNLWASRSPDETEIAADDELATETLGSEKLRVRVLLIIAAAFGVLSLVQSIYLTQPLHEAFRENLSAFIYWRFIVLGCLTFYLLGERLLLGHLIRRQRGIPFLYRYVTAFIETSCPTVTIILAATFATSGSIVTTLPVFIYPIFIVLSALRLNFRLSLFTGAVAGIEYVVVASIYLDREHLNGMVHFNIGVALLLLGVVTGLVALQIKRRILDWCYTANERNRIRNMFGEHVSPVVVDQLLAKGRELRSEKENVCVMFLDIRNFTGFAEKRNPEEVVEYLETLFESMIEIVNRNHGIINKFLGDGFMAVFGAPLSSGSDSLNAVTAAQEILERLKLDIRSGRVPPTSVGIGLHAGEAVTGSIGSALRKEYTVIGDVVNLAARIEKLNKEFGSQLLISETVRRDALNDIGEALPRGSVQVRGREAPIQIYQVA